jgi:hypothetical protein
MWISIQKSTPAPAEHVLGPAAVAAFAKLAIPVFGPPSVPWDNTGNAASCGSGNIQEPRSADVGTSSSSSSGNAISDAAAATIESANLAAARQAIIEFERTGLSGSKIACGGLSVEGKLELACLCDSLNLDSNIGGTHFARSFEAYKV